MSMKLRCICFFGSDCPYLVNCVCTDCRAASDYEHQSSFGLIEELWSIHICCCAHDHCLPEESIWLSVVSQMFFLFAAPADCTTLPSIHVWMRECDSFKDRQAQRCGPGRDSNSLPQTWTLEAHLVSSFNAALVVQDIQTTLELH